MVVMTVLHVCPHYISTDFIGDMTIYCLVPVGQILLVWLGVQANSPDSMQYVVYTQFYLSSVYFE